MGNDREYNGPALIAVNPSWPIMILEDICDGIFDCPHSTPKLSDNGYYMVRTQDIRKGHYDKENSVKVSRESYIQRTKRAKPGHGDILLSREGTYFGDAAEVPRETSLCLGQRMVLLRPCQKRIISTFLRIWINSKNFQQHLLAFRDGTVAERLNLSTIRKLPIPVPSLEIQTQIISFVTPLEEKVKLNRRMNATLEGMAQALFKSWFVDFDPVIDNALTAGNPIPEELAERAEVRRKALADGSANCEVAKQFPAAFQLTEEMGWIPEGWEVLELEKTTSAIIDHRGKTPKKMGSDWAESGYSAVSAKNIKAGKLVRKDTIRFVDQALYEKWMSDKLQKGDLLMTSEAPLGEKLYLAKRFKWVLSQRLFALRANEKISGVFLYHWLNTATAKADLDGRASGTTVQGIRQSELRKIKVLIPSKDCITIFSKASDSLMEKRATNEENIEMLTNLRDTLLPKLISGELRIPEAEKLTEEALV